jgi:hypothetical protein
MGIRVHKMMGYGLTDVVENDPRINWDSPLFRYELDKDEHVDEYLEQLKEDEVTALDAMMVRQQRAGKLPRTGRYEVQSCFEWGTSDGGLENVLCVRPLTMDDWYRYDDIMDYAEQTYFSDGHDQHDDVKVSHYALYPFDSYMDARTGNRIKSDIYTWLRAVNGKLTENLEALDVLARHGGFGSHAEALENCVAYVPEEIRNLCKYAGVFTDPATALTLRPMLYTWWA